MKVVIINKSDSTGGAAVVSWRLMEAMRGKGIDARMLVCEKLTDSPFVEIAAPMHEIKRDFYLERLKILVANGFNRKTLFKIDTGEYGLPLWKHPLVKESDAILLNWINQGMLSLKGVRKIQKLGKPVVWTMHDMWNITGICHHAGSCRNYLRNCGECPLLGKKSSPTDISLKVHKKKHNLYSDKLLSKTTAFVAVSSWLKLKADESSLGKDMKVRVIPNTFNLKDLPMRTKASKDKIRILFGAARLDDPIKGLDTLKEASHILRRKYPDIASELEIAMFGGVKNPDSLKGFELPVVQLGVLKGEEPVRKAYESSDILVSCSSYETLPGTLVEAQAYGCIPVSFNQGGQNDIVTHLSTGYLAPYDSELRNRAENIVNGILWAVAIIRDIEKSNEILQRMYENIRDKFSYDRVASDYISLINELKEIY